MYSDQRIDQHRDLVDQNCPSVETTLGDKLGTGNLAHRKPGKLNRLTKLEFREPPQKFLKTRDALRVRTSLVSDAPMIISVSVVSTAADVGFLISRTSDNARP